MTIAGAASDATSMWRRSIQFRVVVSTLLLSAVVVSLVGWVLLRQITGGLVETKTASAVGEASRGAVEAQDRLTSASGTDFDTTAQLGQLVASIVARGEVQGFEVVLTGPVAGSSEGLVTGSGTAKSPDVRIDSVPLRLRRTVESAQGTSWTFTEVRYEAGSGLRSTPGVVAGSPITLPSDGGIYTLYYLFPMTEQEQTLALVRRALFTTGALLLLLVAAVAFVVTRQVVTPVRLARRVAERLAAGHLEQRMPVRGEDDIARLGTSFNQMAVSLSRQIGQLEELSRVQRRFVSDVSHELRTPLTTVRMAADVLHDARERFDPATSRSAELLQKELNRFELLLTDLLEISRFDAGAAVLDIEDVNLADVARRVVDATRSLAVRRGVGVVVRGPDEPCVAEADGRRVERIVRNLVNNAIDHADGRDVVITVGANEQATALVVRDHGVGLRPGEADLVFNRFWRADPARARTTGGTGLGLSISLEDARLHGGWLEAWGTPGGGAQLRLTLPRWVGAPIDTSPLPLVPDDAAEAGAGPHADAPRAVAGAS